MERVSLFAFVDRRKQTESMVENVASEESRCKRVVVGWTMGGPLRRQVDKVQRTNVASSN